MLIHYCAWLAEHHPRAVAQQQNKITTGLCIHHDVFVSTSLLLPRTEAEEGLTLSTPAPASMRIAGA